MSQVIGIDPGQSGYICQLDSDGEAQFWKLPYNGKYLDEWKLKRLFASVEPFNLIVVEAQHVSWVDGRVSAGTTMYNYGVIRGVLACLNIHHWRYPDPKEWQKVMHAGFEGEPKARSLAACQKLYPKISLLPTKRCNVPNHNMADALLIAAYGLREADI